MTKPKRITMTNLTPLQKRVLNGIKFFQAEYQNGVPYNILKIDLGLSPEDLDPVLSYLEGENYISRQGDSIILKSDDDETDQKTGEVPATGSMVETSDQGEVEVKDQLSETEQKSLEIIRKLVDDEGYLSRTLLEGNLLYGELKLSNIRMYNLITSLENKGIIKKIQLLDGEYYKFTHDNATTKTNELET